MEPNQITQSFEPTSATPTKPSSLNIIKQSFAILKQDKEMVLFPIMAALASIGSALGLLALIIVLEMTLLHDLGDNQIVQYGFLFLYYLVQYYVIMYFNVGLAACVLLRFQGGDPTFKYGMEQAKSHRKAIFNYALLAATLGTILRLIADRSRLLGNIVAGLLGVVWSLATIFIAPVLITSELSPLDAIKESARVFKSTWGDTAKGSLGFGLIAFFGIILATIPLVLGALTSSPVGLVLGIVISVLAYAGVAIVISACSAIYRTALFHYATTRQIPRGFDAGLPQTVKVKQSSAQQA